MGVVRRMAKNTASLTVAKIVSLGSSMVFSVFAARSLGDLTYGTYAFVMVLLAYLMVTSEYGLENLIVRDVADRKEKSASYISSTIFIKLFTSVLSIILLLVILLVIGRENILTVFIWAGLGMIPYTLYMSIDAAFRAHEEMHYIAIIDIIYSVVRATVGIVIVLNDPLLILLFKAFFLVELLRFVLGIALYRSNIGALSFHVDLPLSLHLVRDGFSMAYWRLLGALYDKVDILILSMIIGDVAVGWFKVARNITDMISVGSVIILNVLMPVMTVIHSRSVDGFRDVYTTIFKYILVAMIPVASLVIVYSDRIILFLYGQQYMNAIIILKYLMIAAILNFLLALIGRTLIIIDRFKVAARLSIVTVGLRIVISVYLINRYGFIGACYSSIIIGTISLILHIPIVYSVIGKVGLEVYGPKLAGVLGLVAFLTALVKGVVVVEDVVLVPAAVLFYILLLKKFNVIDFGDLSLFRQGG